MARAGAPPRAGEGRIPIENLPLFPLNTVLFPGGRLPLRIFEQRYMEMAKACLRDNSAFGVCLIREGAEVLVSGVGTPTTPADIGTLASIGAWDMPQLGMLHVTALGKQRFRILDRTVERNGLARASIEVLPEDADAEVPAHCATCVRLLERLIEQHGQLFEPPHRLASSSWVSARLAEVLPLPLHVKQELLELDDARVRLERVNTLLENRSQSPVFR